MTQILTKKELKEIEAKIDEISLRADFLNPSNAIEAKILEADEYALSYYMQIIKDSYRNARKRELGLRLVTS